MIMTFYSQLAHSHLFLGLPTFNTATHYDENIGLR